MLQKAYRKELKIGLTWTKPLITSSSSSDGYSGPTKPKQYVHFIYLFFAMFWAPEVRSIKNNLGGHGPNQRVLEWLIWKKKKKIFLIRASAGDMFIFATRVVSYECINKKLERSFKYPILYIFLNSEIPTGAVWHL